MWLTALSFMKSPKIAAAAIGMVGVVAFGLYVGHLQNKVENLTETKATLTRHLAEAYSVNETTQEAVTELTAANDALARSIVIREDERVRAVQEAAERELKAKLMLDDTLDEIEDLRRETPDCEELSKVDMGAVCPLVTERLRQHAAGTINQD